MIEPSLLVAVTGFTRFLEGDPRYLTVADLERAQGIPRRIRQAVRHYIHGTEWPGLSLEKVAFAWKKLSKAVAGFDPTNTELVEKLIDGLPNSAEISGGYVGALMRVIMYVTEKMPHNADVQMTGIRQRDPAQIDIYRWERCVTLAEEPLYVLQWMHEGRLTGAAVECLEACYPPILETMREAAVDSLATLQLKGGWNLPGAKERQLSLLLGSFATPGLQEAIQNMIEEESTPEKSSGGSPSTAAGSRVAKSYHSTSKED